MIRIAALMALVLISVMTVAGCEKKSTTAPAGTLLNASQRLESSLHNTTRGMAYFYEASQGGFEALTGVSYDALACKNCHVGPTDCTACHTDPAGSDTPLDSKCTAACHSRQAAEVALGYTDVHRTAGMGCADCHTGDDVHGTGTVHNSMWDGGAIRAACEDCHPLNTLAVNGFHIQHKTDMECSACHVQSVVSCYNCHFESEVQGVGKIAFGKFHGWRFLLRRSDSNKIALGNVMSLTYEGKAQVVFAPYHAHTISRNAIASCEECHGSIAGAEYENTGKIDVVTWDPARKKLVPRTGIIPIPPDWETSLTFAHATIDTFGPPHIWKEITPTQVGKQMLFATPLSGMPH